jgi:two-component system, NarL family, sensor histidine kinase UhpB
MPDRPVRLLILEDNPMDLELTLSTLTRGGLALESRHVSTREEFVAAFAEGGWDLILADYWLPGFTGLEALEAVRRVDALLPFVLMSGTLGDERAIESLKSGATDYVLKDNLARLLAVVRRALAEHQERLHHLATQRALQESEARFDRAVRGSQDGLWDWDPDSGSIYYSPRFRALLGWTGGDDSAEISLFRNALHPEDAERILRAIDDNLAGGPPFHEELRLRQPDGTYRWFLGRGETARDAGGRTRHFSGSITDISERRQFEESLRAAHRRLQRLSRRAIELLENERRHLARELHDEIGQVLTAVKINLESVARRISDPALKEPLRDSVEITSTALAQVRRLSLDLRPAQLDDLGLVAALRGHADRQAAVGRFTAHFETRGLPKRLNTKIETACFRVSQEALTNILRHARAANVWIDLSADQNQVTLTVRDDGVGFVVENGTNRATTGESLGLLSMEERIALIGGNLTVQSQPGKGTEVRARVPLAVEGRK